MGLFFYGLRRIGNTYYTCSVSRRSSNPGLRILFDEFVNNPDPLNLSSTVAALETLAVELRDSIEATNWNRRVSYYQDQALSIGKIICSSQLMQEKIPDAMERLEFAKQMVKEIYPNIQEVFDDHMGSQLTITSEQAKTMATILEGKGKMVERSHKLAEKVSVAITYDEQLIQFMYQFISQVVIPNISETKDRIAVAQAAKAYLPAQLKAAV